MICVGAAESPFHVGVSTPDVGALMAALGPVLGLTWVDLPRAPILHHTKNGPVQPASRVVYSREGPLHVELLQAGAGTVYDPARGTHLHHVGYWVDDFADAVAAREAAGWQVEVTMPDEEGRPSMFAYLSRPGAPWIELADSGNRGRLLELLRSVG